MTVAKKPELKGLKDKRYNFLGTVRFIRIEEFLAGILRYHQNTNW